MRRTLVLAAFGICSLAFASSAGAMSWGECRTKVMAQPGMTAGTGQTCGNACGAAIRRCMAEGKTTKKPPPSKGY